MGGGSTSDFDDHGRFSDSDGYNDSGEGDLELGECGGGGGAGVDSRGIGGERSDYGGGCGVGKEEVSGAEMEVTEVTVEEVLISKVT